MPNQEGVHSKFDYQESPGVNRTAWLTEAGEWKVQSPDGNVAGDFRRLTYLGTDGGQWRSQAIYEPRTAGNGGKWVATTFEEETAGGHGKKRRNFFETVDHDGSRWKVEIQNILSERGAASFKLSRI